jgi:hypothetical protein
LGEIVAFVKTPLFPLLRKPRRLFGMMKRGRRKRRSLVSL